LRNKQYCIFNEQYTKEEYQKFLERHPISSHRELEWWKSQAVPIWNNSPHRENTIFKSVDTTGNAVSEAKNSHNVWECTKIENSKNLFITGWARDLYDCTCLGAAELAYECAHSGGVYDSKFLLFCISNDPLKKVTINTVEYSTMVGSVSNCFGCVCVRGAEYTILNKKYTKEEYLELLPKIKKHMEDMPYVDSKGRVYKYGEFFPAEFSSYGYNETTAPDIFPLTKEQALAEGYKWSDYVSDTHYEFSDYKIPDDIKDVGDDILKMILKCEVSGKAYKIVQAELSFYRQAGLPIPRVCGAERHKQRYKMLLPCKLFERKCDSCGKDIQTPYESGRPEVVYCEACYQRDVL
jgi:hypothetical protein